MSCRMCSSDQLESLGPLPESPNFAGIVHLGRFRPSQLNRCLNCKSLQRDPVETQATYTELYSAASVGVWAHEEGRIDFQQIAEFVNSKPEVTSVLDIGAGNGDLLAMLPERLQRCAIEPSPSAQNILSELGFEVIGTDMMSLPPIGQYSVITLVDVLEHVVNPNELLVSSLHLLKSNGFLIIVTGDPTLPVWWRRMKSRYWYSAPQEHVTFPSYDAIVTALAPHGVKPVMDINFPWQKLNFFGFCLSYFLQMSYFILPVAHQIAMFLVKKGRYGRNLAFYTHLHAPGLYRDNKMIILQK
jgi:SAM-dependent methyltransferase